MNVIRELKNRFVNKSRGMYVPVIFQWKIVYNFCTKSLANIQRIIQFTSSFHFDLCIFVVSLLFKQISITVLFFLWPIQALCAMYLQMNRIYNYMGLNLMHIITPSMHNFNHQCFFLFKLHFDIWMQFLYLNVFFCECICHRFSFCFEWSALNLQSSLIEFHYYWHHLKGVYCEISFVISAAINLTRPLNEIGGLVSLFSSVKQWLKCF